MHIQNSFITTAAASLALMAGAASTALAATTVQIGASGKTLASSVAQCAVNPATRVSSPLVQAGLFNPKRGAEATVSLNGGVVQRVETETPSTDVWLATGSNTVVVALSVSVAPRPS